MKLDFNFYMKQVERLIETFGDKNYPGPRVKLLYEIVKELNEIDFRILVDRLILNCKFTPLKKEFETELAIISEYNLKKQKQFESKQIQFKYSSDPYADLKGMRVGPGEQVYSCMNCKDTGEVFAIRKKTGSEYYFECNCDRKPRQPSIQRWSEKLSKAFTIVNN